MKKFKINLAVIAVVLGITAAVGFKPREAKPAKINTFTWYAVSNDGVNFVWQSSLPAGTSCQPANGTCEISTTIAGTPPADGYPSSYTVLDGVDRKSANMSN